MTALVQEAGKAREYREGKEVSENDDDDDDEVQPASKLARKCGYKE